MDRITKQQYYMGIAKAVAQRSPCLKMKVGAVIVKDDTIVSTGYNGPARMEQHCKECVRMNKEHGSEYTMCPAVHAEENAIINAARHGTKVLDAAIFIYADMGKVKPCYRCKRALKNAGIKEIIYEEDIPKRKEKIVFWGLGICL